MSDDSDTKEQQIILAKGEQQIILTKDECAIILREDSTIDVVFPGNLYDQKQVPDHVLAFFGAAFALREKEWIVKLHKLAKEKTEEILNAQKNNSSEGLFEVN